MESDDTVAEFRCQIDKWEWHLKAEGDRVQGERKRQEGKGRNPSIKRTNVNKA